MQVHIDLLDHEGAAGFGPTFIDREFRSDLPLPIDRWQHEIDQTTDPSMYGQTFEVQVSLAPIAREGVIVCERGMDLVYVGKALVDDEGHSLVLIVPPAQRAEDDFGYLRALSENEITSWSSDVADFVERADLSDAAVEAFIAAHSSVA